jgi:hypothetical protein
MGDPSMRCPLQLGEALDGPLLAHGRVSQGLRGVVGVRMIQGMQKTTVTLKVIGLTASRASGCLSTTSCRRVSLFISGAARSERASRSERRALSLSDFGLCGACLARSGEFRSGVWGCLSTTSLSSRSLECGDVCPPPW